jgi:hypothetical protein
LTTVISGTIALNATSRVIGRISSHARLLRVLSIM